MTHCHLLITCMRAHVSGFWLQTRELICVYRPRMVLGMVVNLPIEREKERKKRKKEREGDRENEQYT